MSSDSESKVTEVGEVDKGACVKTDSQDAVLSVPTPRRVVVQRASWLCMKCNQWGHRADCCHFFKTRLCKFHQQNQCTRQQRSDLLCVYAHGIEELRPAANVWCVMIVYQDGAQVVYGCGKPGHHITQCRARQWEVQW